MTIKSANIMNILPSGNTGVFQMYGKLREHSQKVVCQIWYKLVSYFE